VTHPVAAPVPVRRRRSVPTLTWQERAVQALDGAVNARPEAAAQIRARSTWAWWEVCAPIAIGGCAVARLVWALAQ
jgi:hypothetical protein